MKRNLLKIALVLGLASLASACSTNTKNSFCELYSPVAPSNRDTSFTIEQIGENNFVYYCRCENPTDKKCE